MHFCELRKELILPKSVSFPQPATRNADYGSLVLRLKLFCPTTHNLQYEFQVRRNFFNNHSLSSRNPQPTISDRGLQEVVGMMICVVCFHDPQPAIYGL